MADPVHHVSAGPGRASRLGLALFAVYCLCYAGFIGVAAFSIKTLERLPFGGVNLAVIYGFGLIGLAFLLAILYLAFDRVEERS
jgi:uncharacterized membrane protein (DUF485 family)